MDTETTKQPERVVPALVAGALAAFGLAAAFVALTALPEGVTFHLFPVAIAGAPAIVARGVCDARLGWRAAAVAAATGILMVLVSWLAVLAWIDPVPEATLIEDQPGGVPAEFAVFSAVGALGGVWWAVR